MQRNKQIELLAQCALAYGGTSKRQKFNKKLPNGIKHSYYKYWFEFQAPLTLQDKVEKETATVMAHVQLRVEGYCMVITIKDSVAGRMRVLTQLEDTKITYEDGTMTVDSSTVFMQVPA